VEIRGRAKTSLLTDLIENEPDLWRCRRCTWQVMGFETRIATVISVVAVLLGGGPPGSVSVTRCDSIVIWPLGQRPGRSDRRAPDNAERAATPRRRAAHPADGDREGLRILLCSRQEPTTTSTAQTNRLRALLRDGMTPTGAWPAPASRTPSCPGWPDAANPQAPAGSRPYATPKSAGSPWRCARRPARSRPTAPSWPIVNDLVPGLTTRPGSGPISAGHGLRMRPLNREGLNGLLRCLMGADCVRMGSGGSSSSREASWATCSAHPQDRLTPAPP
jgi:hypothetical protein